ncbi:unnamed protein product, partial [Amoebophrya sp. A120]
HQAICVLTYLYLSPDLEIIGSRSICALSSIDKPTAQWQHKIIAAQCAGEMEARSWSY